MFASFDRRFGVVAEQRAEVLDLISPQEGSYLCRQGDARGDRIALDLEREVAYLCWAVLPPGPAP